MPVAPAADLLQALNLDGRSGWHEGDLDPAEFGSRFVVPHIPAVDHSNEQIDLLA